MKKILTVVVLCLLNIFIIIPFNFNRAEKTIIKSHSMSLITDDEMTQYKKQLLDYRIGLDVLLLVVSIITLVVGTQYIIKENDEMEKELYRLKHHQ